MPATRNLLAIDLGAESGRGIVGRFDGDRVQLETVHRFPNGPVPLLDQQVWDAPGLFREILTALGHAGAKFGVDSVGVDTWGVDFGLIGRGGGLLGNPRHYRDPHTEGVMEATFAAVPRADVYRRTGLQFLRFNSLYQLLALRRDRSPLLEVAEQMLLMPDLFHYWLTGVRTNEFTDASTTQLINPRTRAWDYDLARLCGLPAKILGTLVPPGAVLGLLRSHVSKSVGIGHIPVVAPATHDTASAVAAVPAASESWSYLSSGTWSLLGAELNEPIISEASLAANFTNEGGVGGTTRFLKNIMGLWLVQECRRSWQRDGTTIGYDQLMNEAAAAPPFACLIDPDDAGFLAPPDMPAALGHYCRRSAQTLPATRGGIVRACLESLALKYRHVLMLLESLIGRRVSVLHVVGGGSQNELLNQFTADAIARPVIAGPVEATALGNVLVQALGLGLIGSVTDIREVVRRSVETKVYEPRVTEQWDEAYARFARIRSELEG